jgi:hypothetical protein
MEDYLQSAGILVDPALPQAVAAMLNADGQSEAVVIDVNGRLNHVCREPLSDSGWNMYGLGAGFSGVAAVDGTTLCAIGIQNGSFWQGDHGRWTMRAPALPNGLAFSEISAGLDGTIWAIDEYGQPYVQGAAAGQTPPSFGATATPIAVRDSASQIRFFCVDTLGALWTIGQVAGTGAWGTWETLGAPSLQPIGSVAVAANQAGLLQVFALGSGSALYAAQETAPGQWSGWSALAPFDGGTLAWVAAVQNADGRLEILALDANGGAWHIWQTAPNAGWTQTWASLGAPPFGSPAALALEQNQDGRLEVFVWEANIQSVWHCWQTAAGDSTSWSGWSALYIPAAGPVAFAVTRNDAGLLQIFVLATTAQPPVPALWTVAQQSTGGWGSWEALGSFVGAPGSTLVAGQNQDGRLEVFALSENAVLHTWQTAPGSSAWSQWASLGAPGGASVQTLAAIQDRDGRLNLFAGGISGQTPSVWQIHQADSNTGWAAWGYQWWLWSQPAFPALAHPPSGQGTAWWAVAASGGALATWNGSQGQTVALPGSVAAAWVSAGSDGTVWAFGSDGALYQYADGNFSSLPGSLSGACSFSASGATGLWAAADPGGTGAFAVYRYGYRGWQAQPAPALEGNWNPPRVSAAGDGSLYLLDGSGTIWRLAQAEPWRLAARPVPPDVGYLTSLTGAPAGSAWAVDSGHGIRCFKGVWTALQASLPGGAVPLQVTAGAGGALWAIDVDGNPYLCPGANQAWQAIPGLPPLVQAPVPSAPGTEGLPTAWALGKNGTIWQLSGGTWTQFMHSLPDSIWPAQVVGAANDSSVWALDIHGGLNRYDPAAGAWQQVPGAPVGLVQIAVVDAGHIWGLTPDPDHAGSFLLYAWSGGAWQPVAGLPALLQVMVRPAVSTSSDGAVWLLDGNGTARVVQRNQAAESWLPTGTGIDFLTIAAAGIGEAWAVRGNGTFWRQRGSDRWLDADMPMPGGAAPVAVSAGADGKAVWAIDHSGALHALGARTAPPLPAFNAAVSPVVYQDGAGTTWLFAVDQSGSLWTARWNASGDWWSGLMSLGGPPGTALDDLAVALDQVGAMQVLATGGGNLWQIGQVGSGGGWGSWTGLAAPAGVAVGGIVVGPNADGRLQVFAIGSDQNVHTLWQTAANVWSGWGLLSPASLAATDLAVSRDAAGCLVLAAAGTDGSVHCIAQTAPNNGWGSWLSLGAPSGLSIPNLAMAPNQDGRLQVFAVGSDAAVYTVWQTASYVWSAWGPLVDGGPAVSSLAAILPAGGCLQVAAIGNDQSAYYVAQTAPNNGWGAWQPLSLPPGVTGAGGLAVTPGPAGAELVVVSAGASPALWTVLQGDGWASGWSGWLPLDQVQPLYWHAVSGAPSLQQPPSGPDADGQWWAVGVDGGIAVWNGQQWNSSPLPGTSTQAVSVAVGADGAVWAVSGGGSGNICYRYLAGGWQSVAAGLAQAPVGTAAALWSVTAAGALTRSTDGGATWWESPVLSTGVGQVSVGPDGTAWVLEAGGSAAVSPGWQRLMRPTGMPGWWSDVPSLVTAVVAGEDANGVRYAFFTTQDGKLVYTYEVFRHTWVEPILLVASIQLPALGLTRQQDTGALIVYGLADSGASLLAAVRDGSDGYSFSATQIAPWFNGKPLSWPLSGVDLCAVDGAHWYWSSIASPYANALVLATTGAASEPAWFWPIADSASGGIPGGFQGLLPLPWPRSAAAPAIAATDGDGNVWMVSLSAQPGTPSGVFLPLTGQDTMLPNGVTAVTAVWQSSSGGPPQPRLYAMGPASALWVLRQIDPSLPAAQRSAWSDWVPLGGDYLQLAPGPAQAAADTLFAIAADSSLYGVSQEPVTGKWASLEVKRPSAAGDEIVSVAMYQTEITIADGGGRARINLPVTITAETPTVIWVENGAHAIDANQGVTCPTNASGQLNVRTLADDLRTPVLTVQAMGLEGGPLSVTPYQHVHDFLAGSGQLPVGGGQPAAFSAAGLQSATVGQGTHRQPLSPGLSQATAENAVSWTQQITAMPGSGPSSARRPAGWAADLSRPGRPAFHVFATRAELDAYRGRIARPHPGARLPGSFFHHLWHHIKHAAEDVAHAIHKAAVAVDSMVVDVENRVVSFTLKIGDSIIGTFDMIVRSVADALRAIGALLHALIADIEKVIQWLMMLLDWADIWHTKEVLESLINQSLGVWQDQMGTLQAQVQGAFTRIDRDIAGAFQGLMSDFPAAYATFGDLPGPPGTSAVLGVRGVATRGGGRGPGFNVPAVSSVHQNWMLSKTLRNVTPGTRLGTGTGNGADLLDVFNAANVGQLIQGAGASFVTYLEAVFKDPKELLSLTVVELLGLAETLVLALVKVLDQLVEAFLALMAQALSGFGAILNRPLHIPVISALYTFLFNEDLTVLHAGTLLVAIPLTILYKLMNGGSAPFSGIDRRALPEAGSTPGHLLARPLALPITAQQWKDIYLAVGLFNAVVAAIGDGITIAQTPDGSELKNLTIVGTICTLLSDIASCVMQVSSWPSSIGGFPNANLDSGLSSGAWAALGNWVSYWCQPIWDIYNLAFDPKYAYPPEVVTGVTTAIGLAQMVTAILAIELADPSVSDAEKAEYSLGPFTSMMGFLLMPEVRQTLFDSTDELGYGLDTAVAKLAIDAGVNVAVPIINELV